MPRPPSNASWYAANLLPGAPAKLVCVAGAGGTGGELIGELLGSHPLVFCDGEILREFVSSPWLLVRGRMRMARMRGSQAYAFELVSSHLGTWPPDRVEPFVRRLAAAGFLFVHCRRRNLLARAVADLRDEAGAGGDAVAIDVPELIHRMREFELADGLLDQLVPTLPHVTVVYEEDLERPEDRRSTIGGLFDVLGVDARAAARLPVRTSPTGLLHGVANADEVVRVLRATRYATYLDLRPS